MKIGVDARVLMDKKYSGVGEYSFNLILSLLEKNRQEGNPHQFILFYNSGSNIRDSLPDFKEFNPEIKYTRFPNKIFNYLLQKSIKKPYLDKLLGVDLILFPHINFFSLSPQGKSVLTIHDLSFLRYPKFFSLRKNFWHFMLGLPSMVKKVDKIVTISENTKEDIREILGVEEEKIKVIPGKIEKNDFKVFNKESKELEKTKEKYNLPPKFILYLGTLEPRKNVEGIIKAFNIFKKRYPESGYKLIIAGGKGWRDKKIRRTWRNSPYKKDIKFLGYIKKEDKAYLYNLASLFVFPSFYEGFGIPPLEAMACGTPVITSFTSSLPEVVDNAAVMINPYDYKEISRAMEKIVFDKNFSQKLIKKGMERAEFFMDSIDINPYWQLINEFRK